MTAKTKRKKVKKKKARAKKNTHEFVSIKVTGFHVRVNSAMNYELQNLKNTDIGTRIFDFTSSIDIKGICMDGGKYTGQSYCFTVRSDEPSNFKFNATLDHCHVLDHGARQYRMVRGEAQPIYNIPKGVGSFLGRHNKSKIWDGVLWVPAQTISDMLVLLTNVQTLFISLTKLTIDHVVLIVGLTLQTTNPENE